ncbi:MAG: hypothetical protein PHC75_03250 [Burkholderiales bacterium]|nr:hypothetical protein [Burkholderiales bacterium]
MDNFNNQLMDGLYKLLTTKYVDFILSHSLLIGFITGVISLMPFFIKRVPYLVIVILGVLVSFYISNRFDLSFAEAFYSPRFSFVARFLGDFIIGCICGFAVANTIQRIRGEHDHVSN